MFSDVENKRLPHSIRKYLRSQKAHLRETLPPEEARKEIERLTRRARRPDAHAAKQTTAVLKQPDLV